MQNGSEPSAEACQAARRRLIEKRRKKRHARKVHPYSARIGAQGHTTDSPSPSEKIIKLRKAYDAALTCGASKTDLRRIRNRLSAAISRENKEQKLVQLAEQSSNLRKANSLLRRRLADSEHEVASLKAALLLAQQSNHNNKDTLKLSNQSDSLSTDSAGDSESEGFDDESVDLDVFDVRVDELSATWTTECFGRSKDTAPARTASPPPGEKEETSRYWYKKGKCEVPGVNSKEVTTSILDSIFDKEDCLNLDSFDFSWGCGDTA